MDLPTEAQIRRELIDRIQKYSRVASIGVSQIGLLAINDHSFLTDLLAGRNVRISTARSVLDWLDKNPPGLSEIEAPQGSVRWTRAAS